MLDVQGEKYFIRNCYVSQQVRVGPRCFDISFGVNPLVEQLKFLQRALKNRKGGQQSLISDHIFVFDFFL